MRYLKMLGVIQREPLADQDGLVKGEDDILYRFKPDGRYQSELSEERYVLFEVESFFPDEEGYAKAYQVEPHFGFKGVTPEEHVEILNEQKSWNALDWIQHTLKSTLDFNSRARRKEAVFFVIFSFLISYGAVLFSKLVLDSSGTVSLLLAVLINMILFVPNLSLFFRRLTDLDLSRWYGILLFVPIISFLFCFYLLFAEGSKWTNKFGYPSK